MRADEDGRTPLDAAKEQDNSEIVNIIEQYLRGNLHEEKNDNDELEKLRQRCRRLEEQLGTITRERDSLNQSNVEFKQLNEHLKSDNNRCHEHIAQVEAERDRFREHASQMEAEKVQLHELLGQVESERDKLHQRAAQLETENANLRDRLREAGSQNQSVSSPQQVGRCRV